MRLLPSKLSIYFSRQFLLWLSVGFGVCIFLIFMIDIIELMRKSSKLDLGFGIILQMAFLRLPNWILQVMPFAVLFGTILSFIKLTRTQELVIARASGVSVWQFLAPVIALSVVLGVLAITVFNPVAAKLNSTAERMAGRYFDNEISRITVSESGLWLKQRSRASKKETLITAASISANNRDFKDVIIFDFDKNNEFLRRIDAEKGVLREGVTNNNKWVLEKVIVNTPGNSPDVHKTLTVDTNLTLAQIQDSFSSPDTMSFWELPHFIKFLEESGFSALRHKLHYHTILSTPILLAAMVFIAAIFSLRFSRKTKTGLLVTGAVFTGFIFYFLTRLTTSFGMAGNMSITLAAWAPSLIFIIAGVWLLLYLEDG